MKKTLLLTLISAVSVAAQAAEPEAAQLQAFPKNLARQHLGANLFQYSATTQMYSPTQAAAAWLDDDIYTSYAPLPGKQHYLLAFPEAELISNFSVSAKAATGTISLYAGEEAAPPGSRSWSLLAKDVEFESVNEKKLSKALSRSAKYLLIETNLADPGPMYSLYVYGNRPAVAYNIENREEAINTKSIFGPYVNEGTTFNLASLYARGYVRPSEGQSFGDAQMAIDDNPATSVTLGGDKATTLEIRSTEPRDFTRISLEVNPGAKGRFEFFLKNGEGAAEPPAATASVILDGSTNRASVAFPVTKATIVQARWTPADGSAPVKVQEINAFGGGTTLAANMVTTAGAADAIASEDTAETGTKRRVVRARQNGNGKDAKDAKDADPIAALGGPYLPGSLGFPPNPALRIVPPGLSP